jgi:hypothetical protein
LKPSFCFKSLLPFISEGLYLQMDTTGKKEEEEGLEASTSLGMTETSLLLSHYTHHTATAIGPSRAGELNGGNKLV